MKLVNLVIAAVLLPNLVWADTSVTVSEQDFKCYITSKKSAEIAFYRWKTSEMNLRMASLVGTIHQSHDGSKYYIHSAEECVALNAEFTNTKAQVLDKLTPR
ncbi:TapY2 family type IVa secretion system protein [Shewanella putrefaciens]|nr:TapY2 family type IVa secretion system protein [uncultured Shewanella sp.]QYX65813.1 TapY2 family type IVa secretion system protein [Shewanella putrefaciens]